MCLFVLHKLVASYKIVGSRLGLLRSVWLLHTRLPSKQWEKNTSAVATMSAGNTQTGLACIK